MGNANLTTVIWTVAAISGLIFHCVIVWLAVLDWRSVPVTPLFAAHRITATANLRLFGGLAIVQLCWSLTGLAAMLSAPGKARVLVIGGLILPSFILPSLALLELIDRKRATEKLREAELKDIIL